MLRRYKETNEYVKIPFSNGLYEINTSGRIIDVYEKEIEKYKDEAGYLVCYIKFNSEFKVMRVDFLLMITFKQMFLSLEQMVKSSVLNIDGDITNLDLKNLIWKFPQEGFYLESYPEYRIIPGFTRYAINKNGEVINWIKDVPKNTWRNKAGYVFFSVFTDFGKQINYPRHRLLCLAWKEYSNDVCKLDVNHIDGIPGNDSLDNLEWCTRRHNNLHAVRIGLKSDNKVVLMRNVLTNEITSFFSLAECGRQLGTAYGAIENRLKQPGQKIYNQKYQFQFKDSLEPWREIDPIELEQTLNGMPKPILVKDLLTGVVTLYESVGQYAKKLNVAGGTITNHIFSENKRPIHCSLIKFLNDKTPWKQFTKKQIEHFKNNPFGNRKSIDVVDLQTGETNHFPNRLAVAKHFNVRPDRVSESAGEGHKLLNRYKLTYSVLS